MIVDLRGKGRITLGQFFELGDQDHMALIAVLCVKLLDQ